jgi:hypothetical protein
MAAKSRPGVGRLRIVVDLPGRASNFRDSISSLANNLKTLVHRIQFRHFDVYSILYLDPFVVFRGDLLQLITFIYILIRLRKGRVLANNARQS